MATSRWVGPKPATWPPSNRRALTTSTLHVYAAFEKKTNVNGPPSLWSFFSLMQVGDYVIEVGDGKRLGVFRVTGDYQFLTPQERVVGVRPCPAGGAHGH